MSEPVGSAEEFVTVSQWSALVRATDALVHQTEAAAMQARSLQAQVAALGIGLEEAPAAEVTGDQPPLTPAELARARQVLGGEKTRSYFGPQAEGANHGTQEGKQQEEGHASERRGRRSGGTTGK